MKRLAAVVLAGTVSVCTVLGSGTFGLTAFASDSTEGVDYSEEKIGMLLSGSANDGGWSQMAADAARNIEDEYGCTVNFSESVPATDYESVMRGFADAGYNIIVAHGAEFLDTTIQVAKDYPDIRFINTSAQKESMTDTPDNVTGIDFGTYSLGFMTGMYCGYVTESNKIGAIGSNEIASLVAWTEGVKDGAAYVNPDAEVTATFTGSYDDQVKAKQATDTLKNDGCDVITQNADACGAGAVQECGELGLKNVGTVADETKEGDACFVSLVQDAGLGIQIAIDEAVKGTIEGGFVDMGPAEDADGNQVIYASDYSGTYKDIITEDQQKNIDEVMEKLHNGDDLSQLLK